MYDVNITTYINKALHRYILAQHDTPPLDKIVPRAIIDYQTIGLQHLLNGRFSKHWITTQSLYYT